MPPELRPSARAQRSVGRSYEGRSGPSLARPPPEGRAEAPSYEGSPRFLVPFLGFLRISYCRISTRIVLGFPILRLSDQLLHQPLDLDLDSDSDLDFGFALDFDLD